MKLIISYGIQICCVLMVIWGSQAMGMVDNYLAEFMLMCFVYLVMILFGWAEKEFPL